MAGITLVEVVRYMCSVTPDQTCLIFPTYVITLSIKVRLNYSVAGGMGRTMTVVRLRRWLTYSMEELFLDEFALKDTLGTGAFGKVLKAVNKQSNELVAIKFEETVKGKPQLLLAESDVLRRLQGGVGIPRLYSSGKRGNGQYMILELLGPNLQTQYSTRNKDFTGKTILQIAVQSLERIQFIHSRSYLHRDIKPQNFMFGLMKNRGVLYLADYGLAKKYQVEETGMHVPYRENRPFAGTACYASLNTHLGVQQSRRDDLESMMYILIYLMKHGLPWQRKYQSRNEKHDSIRIQKLLLRAEELCSELPHGFVKAFNYIRSLTYDETPNYAQLKNTFLRVAEEYHFVLDSVFDWMVISMRSEDHALTSRRSTQSRHRSVGRHATLASDSQTNSLQSSGVRRKKKRSESLHKKTFNSVIHDSIKPEQPCVDSTSSEQSSYDGSDDGEDESTQKANLPAINRQRLPSASM